MSTLAGVAVGAVAGWVLGRAATSTPDSGLGAAVMGFGVTMGLLVVGFVFAVLVVAGAVMFVRQQRRPMSMAVFAAAAGWLLGYAVALWMV
jgi:F0F1-type ATP synthase assembly protein I